MYIEKRWILPSLLSIVLLSGLAFFAMFALAGAGVASTPAAVPTAVAAAPDPGTNSCAAVAAEPAAANDSQFNDGGFGDIGMQFQNVNIGAPITNIHISNAGNENTTNTIIGDNNTINAGPTTTVAPSGGTTTTTSPPPAGETTPDPAGTTPTP